VKRWLVLLVFAATCTQTPTVVAPPSSTPTPSDPRPSHTRPPTNAAPEASGCAVTLPATSWIADLADFNPLPGSRFQWYGDRTTLAVDLPIDGVYRVPVGNTGLGSKMAWWRYTSGAVQITGARLDAPGPVTVAATNDGYGARGFAPSGVDFPTEGCWQLTGTLGEHALTFIMFVRRGVFGESSP
jgi:hypothetical protein